MARFSTICSLIKTEYEKRTGKYDWKYRFSEAYCAFLDTFVYSWLTPLKVFWESIVRTYKWLPIIWKDRHWDYWFILEIFKQKIRFQRECIDKYSYHLDKDRDVKNMKIAEILIQRLQDADYTTKQMEELVQKWGELEFDDHGLKRTKVYTEKDEKQESREHLRIIKHEEYMRSQDFDYLFKHLKKHIRQWWN